MSDLAVSIVAGQGEGLVGTAAVMVAVCGSVDLGKVVVDDDTAGTAHSQLLHMSFHSQMT